jgi:prevent-host-death family protein
MDLERMPIADARAHLGELATQVLYQERVVVLTNRGRDRAALVPPQLGEAIAAAGDLATVLAILQRGTPRQSGD